MTEVTCLRTPIFMKKQRIAFSIAFALVILSTGNIIYSQHKNDVKIINSLNNLKNIQKQNYINESKLNKKINNLNIKIEEDNKKINTLQNDIRKIGDGSDF